MRSLQVAQVQFKFLQGLIIALPGDWRDSGGPGDHVNQSLDPGSKVRVDLDLTSID